MQNMERLNITIIGAGVVGLAVAYELSRDHKDVFVVERNSTFGQETSSRNSEVIHAGIYYPKDSLKALTCVEGRRLLYEFCVKNDIPHKKTGKLIVAVNSKELADLEGVFKRGRENGVLDLRLLSRKEALDLEPYVECEAAIFSPSTGILDTHAYMKCLASIFKDNGGGIAYNSEFTAIKKIDGGFNMSIEDKREGRLEFSTRVLINCAGLDSDKVAAMAGLRRGDYKLKYCKGDYFRVAANKAKLVNRLVYPVPRKEGAGLGVHVTPDLAGGVRLGPDDKYVDKIDYEVDPSKRKAFYEDARAFMPFIELDDLTPDISGIRPKLQGPGEPFRDFLIREESVNGLPGLINLIGVESPGLTGSLSIARLVAGKIRG